MIGSIDEAWKWYEAVRTLAYDMRKMAKKWDDPAMADILGRDNRLRERTSAEFINKATTILDDLDDLAVLVLFSVFEATVRARAKVDVELATAQMQHPAVLHTVENLKKSIERGSFGKIAEAYKYKYVDVDIDSDLPGLVTQVSEFRNWVAHGRRGERTNNVAPIDAIDRLRRYFSRLEGVEEGTTMTESTEAPPPQTTIDDDLPPSA